MPRCRYLICVAVLVTMSGTMLFTAPWRSSDHMTIDEAMSLVGRDLTPRQRHIVASALSRHATSIISRLLIMAGRDDEAAIEARQTIRRLQEMLR